MSVCMGLQVIINNAFYAQEGANSFLEISALRKFCNILYDKITGHNKSGTSYKYVHFRVDEEDMKNFFEVDNHFIKGIDKVICVEEVKEETVIELNSIYAPEIQIILEDARETFARLLG